MLGLFLAKGFEEVEALAVVDLLRRAQIDVATVSIYTNNEVEGSHGIRVISDKLLSEVDFDALEGIILPGGGPGFSNLEACDELMAKVVCFAKAGKLVAAICGAPSLLGHRGLLEGKTATIFPGMEEHLQGARVVKTPVAIDANIITSRGMGTSIDFGLAIVGYLKGEEASLALARRVVYQGED